MASLRECVKYFQDELRNGIAWIIFWRNGRSWDSDYIYLDVENDTIDEDDTASLMQIYNTDQNAVILNGYYCGHLGKDFTLNELINGVRWHYENHYNSLFQFIDIHKKIN